MHDIDRGANTTAVRLAALAALRKAQGEGAMWDADEDTGAPSRGGDGRSPARRRAQADAEPHAADAAPKPVPDASTGVFAAVEAAVRKSRQEFVARLVEYGQKLDCDTFNVPGADVPDTSMEQAQFIAHRIAGVGKTLGFADLGDAARQTEAAIVAYKLERSSELRKASITRICNLASLIEVICADQDDCPA